MALKLKFNVNKQSSESSPAPARIKIKPPAVKDEPSGGVTKPKSSKDKLKKLKISLGKASAAPGSSSESSSKQTQPILKQIPKVRIKPTRIPGEGYDSEAPDLEDDPLVEQAIAVRFLDDQNLNFLHDAAASGDFSNVNIKWITRDKAVVNVNSTLYSARLIDLPTLTELYKTLDKKNFFKTIDVSQILLVLRVINPKKLNMDQDFEVPEASTYTHPLYTLSVNKEIRPSKTVYRHGLSPAFEDVYRRFRPKKTNLRVMADVESRVDEIVRRDNDAEESHYEYFNPKASAHKFSSEIRANQATKHNSSMASASSRSLTGVQDRDEDNEAEEEEEEEEEDQMALDLEADLDNALQQELADALDSTSNNTAARVLMKSDYANNEDGDTDGEGNAVGAEGAEAEDDEDEDEDDDEDDDEEDEEDEEDGTVSRDNSKAQKLEEEIAELSKAADKQKMLLATASYKMMRMKFQSTYNNLKTQLEQKKRELAKVREAQQKTENVLPTLEQEPEEEDEEDEEDEPEEEPDEEEGDEEVNRDVVSGLGGLAEAESKLPDGSQENDADTNQDDNLDDELGELRDLF